MTELEVIDPQEKPENFYDYLRQQFVGLDEAKKWIRKWKDEFDQEIPGYGLCGMRAMAAMVSDVLEGYQYSKDSPYTNYIATKYGSMLYHEMCCGPAEEE